MYTPLLPTKLIRRGALTIIGGLLSLLGSTALGQALNYTTGGATNVAGTFTSIASTGTAIATASTDNANSAAQNIGFTFSFNGTAFTQFILNTNGFIKLGATAPTSASLFYTPEATLTGDAISSANLNLLSPFNCDLESSTAGASYQVLTSGAAGSQVCTIQWTNVRDKAMTQVTQYANFSFQVKLYEASNRVEFVYGLATAGTGVDGFRFSGAGIKGSGIASGQTVLFTKASSQTWDVATPLTGNYTGNAFNYRQTVRPDAGRTFRFDPQVSNDAAVQLVYGFDKLVVPAGQPVTLRASVRNNGTTALGASTVTLNVSGANTATATQTVASLAAGASTVVVFPSVAVPALGTNTVTVTVAAPGDGNASNNSAAMTMVTNATTTGFITAGTPPVSAFGFGAGAADSYFGAKVTLVQPQSVTAVNAFFYNDTNAVGSTAYGVVIDAASGAVLGRSADFVVTAASLNTLHTFAITSPPTVAAGDVIVGMATVAATGAAQFFLMGVQTENPTRPGTFFTGSATTPAAPTASLNTPTSSLYKYMLEGVFGPASSCVPVTNLAAGSITGTSAQLSFTAASGAMNYTVTLTPAAGAAITTATSPVSLTGLTPGTAYTATVRTNCAAGATSTLASVTFSTPATAPANDDCAAATQLTPGTTCVPTNGTTVGATLSLAAITCGGAIGTADDDVWYRFVATSTAHSVTVVGSTTFDAVIDVRSGPCTGTNIGCADATVAGGTEVASLTALTVGATYYVRVYSYDDATVANSAGAFTICVTGGAAAAPANDNPTGAVVLTVSTTCVPTTSTNLNATTTAVNGYTNPSTTPATCGVASSPKDVWFTFTTLAGQTAATVTVTGTPAGQIRVFSATSSAGPFTQVGCAAGTTNNTQSAPLSLNGLTANTTYYVSVAGFGSGDTQGSFTICVTGTGGTSGPANNECATATSLTPNSTCVPTSGTTVGATQSLAAITCSGFAGVADDDVWYRFTATSPAHVVTVSGNGTFDAVIDVRSGTCPGTNINCADAGGTGDEVVSLTGLTVGATYYVRVYSYGGTAADAGTFTICVTGGGTANDAAVLALYTLGQLPQSLASPHTVQAVVTNNGTAALTARTVTLTVTGANTFTNTQTIASLAAGATATVTFAAYPLTNLGTNTVTVSVPADGNSTNNTQTATQAVTASRLAYVDPAQPLFTSGVGVGQVGGVLAARYTLAQPGRVTSITPTFTGAGTANTTYQLRLYDATGAGGTPGAILYTTAVQARPTATASPVVAVPNIAVGTSFYVAIVELDNNVALGYQFEDPLRPATFYYQSPGGSFTLINTTTLRTRLALEANVVPVAVPCAAITNLAASNVTRTNATLTFTPATGATGYAVTYTPQGGTPQTFTATGSPVGLTGLLSSTLYTVSIVTNCAAGQTSAAVTTTFTTLTPCPAVDNLAASNITPTGATLTFNSFSGSTGFVVTYTPQGGASSTQTTTGSPVTLAGLLPGTPYTVSVVTTCAAGQTSPAVTTTFTTPFPPCPAATNLAVGNVTTTGASVSFTPAAGATGYTVTYTPQGGATTTQTATGSPVTLAGLTPSTLYTVTITTNCASSQTSPAATTTFTTGTPCLAVTSLAAGSITTTGATLTFTPPTAGATSFTVTYTPAGGATITQSATGSPVVLTGLLPSTQYTATVTTNCGGGVTSPIASTSFGTTNPVCNAATNAAAGNITTTSASVSFTPAAGAVSYSVSVTAVGGITTTQTATASPVALTGLTPGTAYTVNIVTNCAAGQTSGSITTTFTTPFPPCLAATNLTATSVTDVTASLAFTPAMGAASYTVTITPQGGTATTQTAIGSPVNLTGLLPGTAYTVSLVTTCNVGQNSPAVNTTFTTLAPAPTNGVAANITDTGASISFTPAAGATSYTVTITPQGGTATTITVTGSPATLTGLTALTNYTVTIVANYPGGATSGPLTVTFRTLMGTATRSTLAGQPLAVYPNPAHHAFTLSVPALGTARTARLTLVNALGQTMQTQTLTLQANGTQAVVDITGLATGLYIVRVQAGAESAATRLMVE